MFRYDNIEKHIMQQHSSKWREYKALESRDAGNNFFAPEFMGQADDSDFIYPGILTQYGFDFSR